MKIAIIGFGIEGKALARHFAAKGNNITICDIQKKVFQKAGSRKINFRLGPHYLNSLQEFDLIFRSPGIPYLNGKFDHVRAKLTSLTRYFFEKCPCRIVGVTGTKGKGTTASLLFEMVKKGYNKGKVFFGGNIGNTPLDFLDDLTKDDFVILELSSFQLQDLNKSPHAAIVLGITEDHFDHHKNMDEYIEAKKNIVRFQTASDFAILDFDNAVSASFEKYTKAKIFHVSTTQTVNEGGFVKIGSFVIKKGKTGIIFGTKKDTNLLGEHNIKNILAAAVGADALKISVESIFEALREFKPLPHRLEFVKEITGVKFYNDSASTNPDTAIAAIRSFSAPLILIAGGSDKNVSFAGLGREIIRNKNVKIVVLMGQTEKKIEQAIDEAVENIGGRPIEQPLEIISAESYEEAFTVARLMAQAGDTVLLSPGCASFDMFKDFKERGDVFKNFVLEHNAEL